jgi:hypothetical protein
MQIWTEYEKHTNPKNSCHATLATNGKHIRTIKLSTQQHMLLTNACPGQNSITWANGVFMIAVRAFIHDEKGC